MVLVIKCTTLLMAAFLTGYFARYKPRRPATLALACVCGGITLDELTDTIHHITDSDPQYEPFIIAARLATSLAVFVLLLIVMRHAISDDSLH